MAEPTAADEMEVKERKRKRDLEDKFIDLELECRELREKNGSLEKMLTDIQKSLSATPSRNVDGKSFWQELDELFKWT